MIHGLFSSTPQLTLELALDATGARAQLIAHNIANADTPNYKALRLRFEDVLARELEINPDRTANRLRDMRGGSIPTHALHGLKGTVTPYGVIYTDDRTTYRLDGNNVDIDHEQAEQAKNALQYSTLVELTSRRLSGLRSVISEGRR